MSEWLTAGDFWGFAFGLGVPILMYSAVKIVRALRSI